MAEPARADDRLSEARYPEAASNAGSVSADSGPATSGPPGFVGSPARPELPQEVRTRPIGEWPVATGSERKRIAERAGARVGSALGTVVRSARRLPNVVQDRAQEMRARFTVIRGRAGVDARDKAEELKDEASRQVRVARLRVQQIAQDSPAGFIAGVAATTFAIGMALGIWRESRRV